MTAKRHGFTSFSMAARVQISTISTRPSITVWYMNIDTDMQYVFTRAIADNFFKNYDGVLSVD